MMGGVTIQAALRGQNAWGDYLGDAPLAMAFLDRLVDQAIILRIKRQIIPRQPLDQESEHAPGISKRVDSAFAAAPSGVSLPETPLVAFSASVSLPVRGLHLAEPRSASGNGRA